jgi:hypothetical protein
LLPQQSVEELLSLAHVQAIAGQAGVIMSYFDLDYGFDGTFRSIRPRGSRLVTQGLAVDFQLKASVNYLIESEHIVYDLEVKNYNDLIERLVVFSARWTVCNSLFLLCMLHDRVFTRQHPPRKYLL